MQSSLTPTSKCHANNTHNSAVTCGCVLCNTQNLLITPERFKDVCLKTSLSNESSSASYPSTSNQESNLKDINSVLEYFFDPNKKMNSPKNNADLLKTYFIGSSSNYESFKAKCK